MSLRRRAFTLLELIVLLAIIGLTVSLSLAAFQRVRESANRTSCKSNLRQIAHALEMFADVNERRYPVAGRHPSLDPGLPRLPDLLHEYVDKDPRIFRCPS